MTWEDVKQIFEEKQSVLTEKRRKKDRQTFSEIEIFLKENYPEVLDYPEAFQFLPIRQLRLFIDDACQKHLIKRPSEFRAIVRFLRKIIIKRELGKIQAEESDAEKEIMFSEATALCLEQWLQKFKWKTHINYSPRNTITVLYATKENKDLWIESVDSRKTYDYRGRVSEIPSHIYKQSLGVKLINLMGRYSKNPQHVCALAAPGDGETKESLEVLIPALKQMGILLFYVKSSKVVTEATGQFVF
jgi:hypothetical protein